MRTVDTALVSAPVDECFRLAADVEAWPDILPHYRWVRFHRRDGFARGVVEMAAWRPFGPLKYPTWWVSEMDHDPDNGVIRYLHIEGITKGMEVVWRVAQEADGLTSLSIVHEWSGPPWPLIGPLAANLVIGPQFVSHIAGRTLEGVARAASEAANP